jgi:hypothetical protein
MRSRIIVGDFLLIGALASGTVATSGDGVAPHRQWALVNFANPVSVNGDFLMGTFLIVHDDTKMAQGKPCTSFYRFDTKKGPQEEVVAFHCKPAHRTVADRTTLRIVSRLAPGLATLTEYQFAGDTEAHGIPVQR